MKTKFEIDFLMNYFYIKTVIERIIAYDLDNYLTV